MTCHGPQLGKPCLQQGDCDVACSCDPPGVRLSPNRDHLGPMDGTKGAHGTCAGDLQIGVWMCRIDGHGVVKHMIAE